MRIVCPSCTAAYDVADSLVRPGRIVQCARCGEEWVALSVAAPLTDEEEPEADESEAFAESAESYEPGPPRLTAMDRLAQTAAERSRYGEGALRAAWAVSIVAVLALLWGAYTWRAGVMHGWPASTRLYSVLGLVATAPH